MVKSLSETIMSIPHKDLKVMAFRIEDVLISIVEEFAEVDAAGDVLPIANQYASMRELMKLINW